MTVKKHNKDIIKIKKLLFLDKKEGFEKIKLPKLSTFNGKKDSKSPLDNFYDWIISKSTIKLTSVEQIYLHPSTDTELQKMVESWLRKSCQYNRNKAKKELSMIFFVYGPCRFQEDEQGVDPSYVYFKKTT